MVKQTKAILTSIIIIIFFKPDISIIKYNKNICEVIGKALSAELPEVTIESFMKLLIVLDSTKVHFEKSYELIQGACLKIDKFLLDESI